MATALSYARDSKTIGGPARKKLKTSDLPLASATRAAIEGLAHTFKKKGGYDSLRKQVWDDLEGSVSSKSPSSQIPRTNLTSKPRVLKPNLHGL